MPSLITPLKWSDRLGVEILAQDLRAEAVEVLDL